MIKPNKEYRVYKVKKGVTKNGTAYSIIKIADSYKDANAPNGWAKRYYSVYIGADVDVFENGKITLAEIEGVKYQDSNFNGKTYIDCTLFASLDKVTITDTGANTTAEPNSNPWESEEMPF